METKYIVAIGIVAALILFYWFEHKASTTCTDADGNQVIARCRTAPCPCPKGASTMPWVSKMNCEKTSLNMPHKNDDGKILQVNNPMYGMLVADNYPCGYYNDNRITADCVSIYSNNLKNDVANGNDINLVAGQYGVEFNNDDPCPKEYKYVKFDYRYI
jgi:hypothetical protein